MFGFPEGLMIVAIVVQSALFAGIAYFGVRMMRRHGVGYRETSAAPDKPIGL